MSVNLCPIIGTQLNPNRDIDQTQPTLGSNGFESNRFKGTFRIIVKRGVPNKKLNMRALFDKKQIDK